MDLLGYACEEHTKGGVCTDRIVGCAEMSTDCKMRIGTSGSDDSSSPFRETSAFAVPRSIAVSLTKGVTSYPPVSPLRGTSLGNSAPHFRGLYGDRLYLMGSPRRRLCLSVRHRYRADQEVYRGAGP